METEAPNTGKDDLGTRSEVEVIAGCRRRVKASIPVEKVREELDKNYRQLSQSVQLPGFRRGHVPRRLLEARFGEEIEGDVKESLLAVSFAEVVEGKELKVLGSPRFENVSFTKDADLTYEVDLEVRPEFEVDGYKGIEVEREALPMKDEYVDATLKNLQSRHSKLTAIEPAEAGADDYFRGTYRLYRDDVLVKTSEKVTFVPSTKQLEAFTVPDLPERFAAWDRSPETSGNSHDPAARDSHDPAARDSHDPAARDSHDPAARDSHDPAARDSHDPAARDSHDPAALTIDVKVPADFPDEVLRGAEARLQFQLEEALRRELPPLDEAFAKERGAENLDALKAMIREELSKKLQRDEETLLDQRIMEKLTEKTSMDLPEGLLEGQKERLRLETEYKLLEEGLPADEVERRLKEGEEQDSRGEDIRRALKSFFILDRIADLEKILVMEREVDERVRALSLLYRAPPERLREELRKTGRLEELRTVMRHDKVRKFLRENAKVLKKEEEGAPSPPSDSGSPTRPADPSSDPVPAGPGPGDRREDAEGV